MNIILKDLVDEHRLFLAALDIFSQSAASTHFDSRLRGPLFRALSSFLNFLEKEHHGKEEDILFPILDEGSIADLGGVKCALYFTPRVLETGSLNSYRTLREAMGLPEALQPPPGSSFRGRMFAKKSMLTVPLEDHILGAAAAKWILGLEQKPAPEIASALKHYAHFLRGHIKREDDCLFPQCERSLKEAAANAYREKARRWNQERAVGEQIKAIEAQLEGLKELLHRD